MGLMWADGGNAHASPPPGRMSEEERVLYDRLLEDQTVVDELLDQFKGFFHHWGFFLEQIGLPASRLRVITADVDLEVREFQPACPCDIPPSHPDVAWRYDGEPGPGMLAQDPNFEDEDLLALVGHKYYVHRDDLNLLELTSWYRYPALVLETSTLEFGARRRAGAEISCEELDSLPGLLGNTAFLVTCTPTYSDDSLCDQTQGAVPDYSCSPEFKCFWLAFYIEGIRSKAGD